MHYPKPNTPTARGTTIPRTLTPIVNKKNSPVPPEAAEIIGSANRTFLPGWTCSTHVFQAAFPRESPPPETRNSPSSPAKQLSKTERQALADANFARIRERRDAIAMEPKISPNNTVMWTAANRYAPDRPRSSNDPAVTLVVSHATGFHKEIWETTFRYLISMMEASPHQLGVDEIWALDSANHGDSALLNKSNLGDIFEWSDHARDILNFMVNFLPESVERPNGISLPQVSEQTFQQRRDHGFKSRTIIGLGHSFGGCTLARAIIDSPKLFSSAILLDPVIFASYAMRGPGIHALTKGALARRDHWPDREAAKAGLLNSPFFQAWHPDVLADYVKYGTYESESEVRLKCSGYQEAGSFSENARLPCEVWELLPSLDERIPLKWIMDSTTASTTGGPELTRHTVWRRPTNSTNVQIKGAGHLIPQEAPEALAHEILEFIRQQHGDQTKASVKSKL